MPARCSWGTILPAELPDDFVEMRIVLHTTATTPLAVNLPFTATANEADAVPEDNALDASLILQAPGTTDLALTGTRSPAIVTRGNLVTYDLVVHNETGNANATTGVVVTLAGPAGGAVTTATWGSPATACSITGADATCSIGPMTIGGTETVHVELDTDTVTTDANGVFAATFDVDHGQSDPTTVNDRFVSTTTVAGAAPVEPLILAAAAAPVFVATGATFTYTVTVRNPNATPAVATTVRLLLPAPITPNTGTVSPGGAISGRIVTWSNVAVPAKAGNVNGLASLTVQATAGAPGALPFPSTVDGVADGNLQPDVAEEQAGVTIRPLPVLTVGDVQVDEGGEAFVPVDLAAPWVGDIAVRLQTAAGSAVDPVDFTRRTGVNAHVDIPAGETHGEFRVVTLEDALDEVNETFTVTASAPTAPATLADASGTVTILDDDAPPRVTVGDARVVEGDVGTVAVFVDVKLLEASGRPVSVTLRTRDGSARAGTDYTAATRTLAYAPGEKSHTFRVDLRGDAAIEPDEAFDVVVLGTVDATATDDTGRITIANDDVATPPVRKPLRVTASAAPLAVPRRGRVTYTVRLRNVNADVLTLTRLRACLPAGFTFIRGSTRGAIRVAPARTTCGRGRIAVTWRRTLAIGGGRSATFTFRARAGRRLGTFTTAFSGVAVAPYGVRPSGPAAPVRVRRGR